MSGKRELPLKLTRRHLLGAAALSAGAIASRFGFTPEAMADMVPRNDKQRFIICTVGGGWDQLLFLDPRDPDRYTDANRNMTLTDTGYGQVGSTFTPRVITAGNLTFGPAVDRIGSTRPKLMDHYDKIAIVRGVNMGTLSHVQGYRYFLTGQFPSGNAARGTSFPTESAGQMNSGLPLPVVALNVEAYNERQPGRFSAFSAQSIFDVMAVLRRDASFLERDDVEQALAEYAARDVPCAVNVYDRRGILTQMRQAEGTTKDILRSDIALRLQFVSDPSVPPSDPNYQTAQAIIARNADLRARFGFDAGDYNSVGARAAFASLVIREQIAQCVSVTLDNGVLDTHTAGSLSHATSLAPSVEALAALIDDLANADAPADLGGKWIDHTTILCFSEFARTPLFNGLGGRDHHLASSCLLAGGGIQGNKVVGETGSVAMGVGLYDFQARRTVPSGGDNIRPEDIIATMLASAGLSFSHLRSVGRYSQALWDIIRTS